MITYLGKDFSNPAALRAWVNSQDILIWGSRAYSCEVNVDIGGLSMVNSIQDCIFEEVNRRSSQCTRLFGTLYTDVGAAEKAVDDGTIKVMIGGDTKILCGELESEVKILLKEEIK